MSLTPEKRTVIQGDLISNLEIKTNSLLEQIEYALSADCVIPDGTTPTAYFVKLFSSFSEVRKSVLPPDLTVGFSLKDREAIGDIVSRVVETQYRWFLPLELDIPFLEDIERANQLEGVAESEEERLRIEEYFKKHEYKGTRRILINQICEHLKPTNEQREIFGSIDENIKLDFVIIQVGNLGASNFIEFIEGSNENDRVILRQIHFFQKLLYVVDKFFLKPK